MHLSGSAQKKTTTWCQKIFNMQIITMVTSAGVPTEVLKIVILKFFGGGEFFSTARGAALSPISPNSTLLVVSRLATFVVWNVARSTRGARVARRDVTWRAKWYLGYITLVVSRRVTTRHERRLERVKTRHLKARRRRCKHRCVSIH